VVLCLDIQHGCMLDTMDVSCDYMYNDNASLDP